jgi:hypothetical protein
MSGDHQPNPEFVNQLEWQIRSSLRRRDRFSSPVASKRRDKMKLVAMILISAFFGAGAAVATEEVQESRAQEILLTRLQGQYRIAEIQLQIAQTHLQEVQERVGQGLMQEEVLLGAELMVREGEHHLNLLALNEEEVRASGQAPQDEISAPLIGGKDFVSERLELESSIQRLHLSIYQSSLVRIEDRIESGLVPEEEMAQARRGMEEFQLQLDGIQKRLDLRARYLRGEITAQEAETEQELKNVRIQLQSSELAHRLLGEHYQSIAQMVEAGLQTESTLTQLRFELLKVEMEIETLRRTIELLEAPDRGGVM